MKPRMAAAHPPSARPPPYAARRPRPRDALGRTARRPRETDCASPVWGTEQTTAGTNSGTFWPRQPPVCDNQPNALAAAGEAASIDGTPAAAPVVEQTAPAPDAAAALETAGRVN